MRETASTIRARLVRALDFHCFVNPHLTWRARAGAGGGHAETTRGSLDVIGKRRAVALWRHVMAGHQVVKRTIMSFGRIENTLRVGDAKQIALDAGHVFGRLNGGAAAN